MALRLYVKNTRTQMTYAKNSTGTLVYLMGASGAGKDTFLHAARALVQHGTASMRPLVIAQRHITRPASGLEKDEAHYPCSEQDFIRAVELGQYAMHWQSHGHFYGISRHIDEDLKNHAVVLVNGSRAYVPKALQLYPQLVPVLLQVDPQMLRQRLLTRGRESIDAIEARVQRAQMKVPHLPSMKIIDNSEALDASLVEFTNFITHLRTC